MNDKDRDRDGDGAGPVANPKKSPYHYLLRGAAVAAALLLLAFPARAQQPLLRGLSLTVDAGVLFVGNGQANFYNGAPGNANTLERILHSETFGRQIWEDLTEQDLITSNIANYTQLQVAEYGDMYYKTAFQLGFGLRYDFEKSDWAWLARFNYVKLNAVGMMLLESGRNNASSLTNQNAYVNCPMAGVEKRIFFDLGLVHKFQLDNGLDLEVSAGANANNTQVVSSEVLIAGTSYSILDLWNGQYPSPYTQPYEYVNQGGLGYGGFAGVSLGLTLPSYTAVSVGYTFHYTRVNLQGYEDFAPHHVVAINVALNNFSFFDD